MLHTETINISEIINNSTDNEKEQLVEELFSDFLSKESLEKFNRWWLNDRKECELEFHNRKSVLKAYDKILSTVDEY